MNPAVLLSLLADLQETIVTLRQQVAQQAATIATLQTAAAEKPEPKAK